ncbi:MAG TPA: hypothetical protein PJ997_01705 [Candidatus Paceibacterota bacterium]|nr:hypothetical protein [Candidatus Paceibacterota bacterium]HMP19033.1 hypothetical protein [Candidatus Paceibacterota bacterium]HMP85202.1 hypothetical protein [Candidatus Paceibacterota bacterium]
MFEKINSKKEKREKMDSSKIVEFLKNPFFKTESISKILSKKSALLSIFLMTAIAPVIKNLVKEETENKHYPAQQEQALTSVFGKELLDKIGDNNFFVQIKHISPSGKYIIHIGQSHISPLENNVIYNTEPIMWQRKILIFLEDVAKISDGKIYDEGFSEESKLYFESESSKNKINAVVEFNQYLDTVLDFELLDFDNADYVVGVLQEYIKILNTGFADNVIDKKKIEDILEKLRDFIYKQKAENEYRFEINPNECRLLTQEDVQFSERISDLSNFLINFETLMLSSYKNVRMADFNCAATHLYLNGKIDVLPAEDKTLNQIGIEKITYLNKKINELHNIIEKLSLKEAECSELLHTLIDFNFKNIQNTSLETYNLLRQKLLSWTIELGEGFNVLDLIDEICYVKKQFDILQSKREDFAIESLTKDGFDNHKVMIYGVAHDFTESVKRYNASNSDEDVDIGLIKISDGLHFYQFR